MPPATVPLDDLAQRIARQESELESLRTEYEGRQGQLGELTRRKQELEAQVQRVEGEIQAINEGRTSRAAPAAAPTSHPKAAAPSRPNGKESLPELLVIILRQAARPLTVSELTEEVERRKFKTQSTNLKDMIKTRIRELEKKSVLRRSEDKKTVSLGRAAGTPKATPPRKAPSKAGHAKASAAPTSTTQSRRTLNGQRPLPEVLTELLQKSKQPLSGAELARQAEAAGHRSDSNAFVTVVWATLPKMKNVVHVPGKGYRLKKR